MKKKILMLLPVIIILCLASASSVIASGEGGNIIITPPWPTAVNTPATFTINAVPGSDPTYDLQILLAMTVECYNGLPGSGAAVEITWSGGGYLQFEKSDFQLISGNPPPKVPPDAVSEKQYDRANLADHLGLPGDSSVYWAMKPFPISPDGQLHTTPLTFVVTLHSSSPRMLVYALGKEEADDPKFNHWVAPTNPGFVVPEVATIITIATSLAALLGYKARRRILK